MIRLFFKLSKCFSKNNTNKYFNSELDLLNDELQSIDITKLSCTHCNAKYAMSFFGSYKRHLVTYDRGVVIDNLVTIPRYICSSCNRTHAAISSVIIPYVSFSFGFLLSLLKAYIYKSFSSIEDLCSHFLISFSTFYRIYKLFKDHKSQFLGFLDNKATSDKDFLALVEAFNYLELLQFKLDFFKSSGIYFFQSKFTLPAT